MIKSVGWNLNQNIKRKRFGGIFLVVCLILAVKMSNYRNSWVSHEPPPDPTVYVQTHIPVWAITESVINQPALLHVCNWTRAADTVGMGIFEKNWRLAAVFIFVTSMGGLSTVFVQRGPDNCQNRISRWFIYVGSSFLPRMFSEALHFFPLCRINRLCCFQHWKG